MPSSEIEMAVGRAGLQGGDGGWGNSGKHVELEMSPKWRSEGWKYEFQFEHHQGCLLYKAMRS